MSSPIHYENRDMPRSGSYNSKLENLREISSKWFSKKGSTTSLDTNSSIGSANTSPVDAIPTLRSGLEGYSPFSSRNSAISYRPPLTPPNAYPTSPHLQSSPGQTSSRMSTSPSNASSICTAASSVGSTSSAHRFSDCCFCDIPLVYILGSEDIVELTCTHLAHFECLLSLSLVLNKNRVSYKQPRLPPCGVCDEASTFVDRDLSIKFSESVRDMASVAPISPITTSSTGEPPSPVESVVSVSEGELTASEEVKMPTVTSRRISQAIKSCKCQMAGCIGASCEVEFSAQLSQALPESGPAKVQCLINVTVPEKVFYHNGYIRTPRDDVQVYNQISKLKRFSFKGVSLNRLDMSQLRLVSNFKVSSDLCNWSNCKLYLLADSLVLTSNNDAQVKAVIDHKSHLASAKILGRDLVPHIELVIKSLQKSKLYLICDEIEPLEALCAALHNDQLSFPVDGDLEITKIPENHGQVLYRTPLNLVLCVEQPESPLIANTFVESLATLRKRMGQLDRLSLVIYGSSVRSFGFQPASYSGWSKIEDTLRKSVSSKTVPAPSLDKCLETAEELLHNLRIERSLACVMIVNSSSVANANPISHGFITSSTPIHTIGIGERCDFTALSTLSAKSDGVALYCDPQSIAQKVGALYDYTSSRTHKNVEMKLVPRDGVDITRVSGWNMVETLESLHSHTDDEVTTPDNSEAQPKILPLGNLYEGTTRSFIVNLEIQECSSLSEMQVLQTTLFSRTPQSISYHRCTTTNAVSASNFAQENVASFTSRQASLDACELACELAKLLMDNQHKQVFNLTQSDRCQFVKRYTNADEECDYELVEQLKEFDEFFDEFSNKLFQPRAPLAGELFNFIWTTIAEGLALN